MQINALSTADARLTLPFSGARALVPWSEGHDHVNAVAMPRSPPFEGIRPIAPMPGDALLVFRLHEHLQRFVDSARLSRVGMPHDVEGLAKATSRSAAHQPHRGGHLHSAVVLRQGIVRQLLVPEGIETETLIDSWPFASSLGGERGVKACVSSWRRIDDQSMPPRVKAFSNYHNARFAALEATRAGFGATILLDRNGKVTEGPASCIAMVRDGALVTPPVYGGILESITRDTLLVLAREELGLAVVERPIDRSELHVASELFFMGTAWRSCRL